MIVVESETAFGGDAERTGLRACERDQRTDFYPAIVRSARHVRVFESTHVCQLHLCSDGRCESTR
eukprot:819351-Prymnesium_polylepis.1